MIDSRLKRYWLAELEQSAISLEKLYRSSAWNGDLEFSVEKSIFLGFYAIRKLKESGLLPNNVISLNWKITTYPKADKPRQNKFIDDYQLFSGSSKQFSLEALCNQFVHSNHFLRISVIAIARFGLFRSPDPAVFLSSYFYSK